MNTNILQNGGGEGGGGGGFKLEVSHVCYV